MTGYPEPIVGVLIQNPAGKFLVLRGDKFVYWTIPGGHVEVGETVEETIKREVKEEVGLDVDSTELINVQNSVFDKDFFKDREAKHMIFLNYVAKTTSNDVKVDMREFNEYKWVNLEELEGDGIGKYTREIAKKMREKLCNK